MAAVSSGVPNFQRTLIKLYQTEICGVRLHFSIAGCPARCTGVSAQTNAPQTGC